MDKVIITKVDNGFIVETTKRGIGNEPPSITVKVYPVTFSKVLEELAK